MTLKMATYARRPFVVEAVQITTKNMKEIAALGVGQTRKTQKGVPFIQVHKGVMPVVSRVYPGFWFTRTDSGQIRCYTDKMFRRQYAELDGDAELALKPYMLVEEEATTEAVLVEKGAKTLEETIGMERDDEWEVPYKEGSTDLASANPAVGRTVKDNIFTKQPPVEEIKPGGTYTPGRINRPPEEIDVKHRVTDELHVAVPTETGNSTAENPPGDISTE